jgi:hypothetical protein
MASIINASTSSGLVQSADTSGTLQLQSNGTTQLTVSSTGVAISNASLTNFAGGAITASTAVASTSGTAIDFTGIPSWAKRITVMLSNVSTNGASNLWIQLGTSGGIISSGYLGSVTYAGNLNAFSSSFIICNNMAAGSNFSGHCVITNITGNTWVESGIIMRNDASANGSTNAGYIALASALTTVRITSTTPDTFDAGTINIFYEG